MGRLLDRYVTREFLRLYFLFLAGVPVMLTVFDITDSLDKYLERGLPVSQIALGYAYQLPLFVLYAVPIAALVATIFTVNGMGRHSEVAAAKAAGVSFYRLMAPLPILGIFLSAGALALAELVPVTNRLRAEVLEEKMRMRSARSDFVFMTRGGHVFAIRRLDVDANRIQGIAMERAGERSIPVRARRNGATVRQLSNGFPTVHAMAEEAVYDTERGRWILQQGRLRFFHGDREHTIRFEEMLPVQLVESPEELLADQKDPDEMRYAELGRFIEILERSGARPLDLMVERIQKITLPLATLIIILFAAPLAVTSARGGPAYGVGISLAVTILYLILFRIFGAAGATGALPPALAAWLPNIIFVAAAAVLALRVRT